MTSNRPILIVEDDTDARAVLRRTFIELGYRTTEAGDGIAALHVAQHDPPALIVLDLGLPGQDGWTVAQQIRAEPRLAAIPILVITAYDSGPARAAALGAGCQYILQKPFAITALEDAVAVLLR